MRGEARAAAAVRGIGRLAGRHGLERWSAASLWAALELGQGRSRREAGRLVEGGARLQVRWWVDGAPAEPDDPGSTITGGLDAVAGEIEGRLEAGDAAPVALRPPVLVVDDAGGRPFRGRPVGVRGTAGEQVRAVLAAALCALWEGEEPGEGEVWRRAWSYAGEAVGGGGTVRDRTGRP